MKCVYKISCVDKEVEEFYIGSTINLEDRIRSHKSRIKLQNTKLYKFIREHGGLSNWEINPIEIYECEMTKLELKQEEQFYINEYKPKLNCLKAFVTIEQKQKEDKIRKKLYYENNKEKVLECKQKSYAKHSKKYAIKRKEKAKCPYCNVEMLKNNINRHIKTQHPISTQSAQIDYSGTYVQAYC